MHLVFLNQYYPPDAAPTGVMLQAVVGQLVADGHRVTVICAEGGYARTVAGRPPAADEAWCNPAILRISATRFGRAGWIGKMIDYASYYLGTAMRLAWMHPRPERVVALTTPPYLSVLARLFSRFRGADHAHWVMDVYPDVMVAHGMLCEGSWRHRFLAGLAAWGMSGKRCRAVVTLGPDMAARLETQVSRGAGLVAWVPLWSGEMDGVPAGEAAIGNRRQRMGWKDDELVVMYSGNMGLGHRFDEILEVIRDHGAPVMPPDPSAGGKTCFRFVFFGGGRRRREIEEFVVAHPEAPVELHDYVPQDQLAAHLRSADVHLVSLEPSWTGTMLPSKLQGIFAAARPVVFVGDGRSGMARWIRESGGGWVVAPGDVEGLVSALREVACDDARARRGAAAKVYAESHFDRDANARRMTGFFTS